MSKPANKKSGKVRIIGGKWRSRRVEFPDLSALRPTPDRVRETLFNWLQGRIRNARCFEPYAGSGILSMEALSRGAASATLIDKSPDTCRHIDAQLQLLGDHQDNYRCIKGEARRWLAANPQQFDLIFLDPPFAGEELELILALIATKDSLSDEGVIYIEAPRPLETVTLPASLRITRAKKAASVHYGLCETRDVSA